MTVLINAAVLPGKPGGIANYAYYVALHLARHAGEAQICLVVPRHLGRYFSTLKNVRVFSIPFHSQWVRIILSQLWVPWLARRATLVHSVGNYGLLLRMAPQTIFVHDTYEKTSPDRFGAAKRWLLSKLITWTGRRARAILTNSENTREDIARHYPELTEKVFVTYLGTKFSVQEKSLDHERHGFLFVGTLEPGKRAGDVLEAFSLIQGRYPEHPLRIVGQAGWGTIALREKAHSLGIAGRVEFSGYVTDEVLAGLYGTSLALIQASSYEGFGLPVVEAMACACPVIVAENSALREVGAGAAVFFPTGNVPALAEAMERIASDPVLRRDLSKKCLERARAFRWEKTARETLDIFRTIAPLTRS